MPNHRGKFSPTYKGPYMVKKAFFGGGIIRADIDGHDFNMPTYFDADMWYFAWGSLQVQPPFYIPMQNQKKKKKKSKKIQNKIWKGRLKTQKGGLHKRKVKERMRGSLLDWKPKRAV